MARDKRRTIKMMDDMNNIEPDDMGALTDQEQQTMQLAETDPAKRSSRRKKAM